MFNLKPKIDFKKQRYAESKFMLPPMADELPQPFESIIKSKNNSPTKSNR